MPSVQVIDLEVSSVLRRMVLRERLSTGRAEHGLVDLVALGLQRAPHRPLLVRCWSLRDSLSVYDASYVALAEALGCALVTDDARLSRASGLRCPVEVVRPG